MLLGLLNEEYLTEKPFDSHGAAVLVESLGFHAIFTLSNVCSRSYPQKHQSYASYALRYAT